MISVRTGFVTAVSGKLFQERKAPKLLPPTGHLEVPSGQLRIDIAHDTKYLRLSDMSRLTCLCVSDIV